MMRLFFISLLLCFITSCKPSDPIEAAPRIDPTKKEIVFVTHNGPSTYYLDNENQPAGMEYDLAVLFVNEYFPSYEIRFLLADSISDVIPSLLKLAFAKVT